MTSATPAQTLDRRIRADLERQIRSGAWPPGHRIPIEQKLMAQYGCARATVGKAILALAQAGLVQRRKRAGSFVAHPHMQTAVLEIPDIPAVIAARGETYRFQLVSRTVRLTNDGDPQEAAIGAQQAVLAVRGVHIAGERPFAWERRILNLTAVPDARTVSFESEPPGSWLLRHVPWTQARHRITALNADAETTRRLGLRRDLACLQVERWTWRLGDWITFVRQVFPGDRYDLVAEFTP